MRVSSGDTAVNAVQAELSYPATDLEFAGIDTAGTAFSFEAPSSGGGGHVTIARGTTTPVVGDNLVANVTFRVLKPAGRISMALTPSSIVADATTNQNILTSTAGSTLKVDRSKK